MPCMHILVFSASFTPSDCQSRARGPTFFGATWGKRAIILQLDLRSPTSPRKVCTAIPRGGIGAWMPKALLATFMLHRVTTGDVRVTTGLPWTV